MELILLVTFGFFGIVQHTEGHSALLEPPARNVMWRRGFNNLPYHPQDDYLICYDNESPGCPPCGDGMETPFPHPHEAGGKWATGIITRSYQVGQVVDIFVNVSRSHGGYLEFKICPNNNIQSPVSQDCLDRYPLQVVGQASSKVKIKAPYDGLEEIKVKVKMPAGLTCSQCVLQMSTMTDQYLPYKMMFRNCADVEIKSKSFQSDRNQFKRKFGFQ